MAVALRTTTSTSMSGVVDETSLTTLGLHFQAGFLQEKASRRNRERMPHGCLHEYWDYILPVWYRSEDKCRCIGVRSAASKQDTQPHSNIGSSKPKPNSITPRAC